MEVQANAHTKVINSPKKFKVDEKAIIEFQNTKCHQIKALEGLNDIAEHQSVSVAGKVTSLFPIKKITIKATGKELQKWDLFLSDNTPVYRCVAWETDIDLLQENSSYRITNATIRTFNSEKYISIGRQSEEVTTIKDIGEAIDNESPQKKAGGAKVITSEIIAVLNIDHYKSCHNCSDKLPHSDKPLVVCQKCNAKMKLARCPIQSMANIILEDDTKTSYHVTIFNDVFDKIRNFGKQIIEDADIDDQLLSSPPLSYTVNQKDIVTSVAI